eukprot:2120237-Alexandrium_andersonii.AAC.1
MQSLLLSETDIPVSPTRGEGSAATGIRVGRTKDAGRAAPKSHPGGSPPDPTLSPSPPRSWAPKRSDRGTAQADVEDEEAVTERATARSDSSRAGWRLSMLAPPALPPHL